MIPPTKSDAICWIFRDISKINPVDNKDPINAASTSTPDEKCPICFRNIIIVNATTILAPEEIPSTNGPAIGFEKKVCNKKPDRDNAPPSIAAIRMRGSRIFQIILYSTASPSLMNNILNIFGTEICTFPVLIFNTIIAKNAARSPRNTTVYLERLLKFSL